ncbi:hypothetical protein AZKH_p0536 (plasmid) [Azoarcus sp. KH32C]|nr:hypothetical protein AZKH_p0536 [Azoarcus sp. KH32C]
MPYTCAKLLNWGKGGVVVSGSWPPSLKPSDGKCTARTLLDGTLQYDPLDPDCSVSQQCTVPDKPEKTLGTPDTCVGNPVNVATGNKYQREADYVGMSSFPLSLIRHYNSQANVAGGAGYNWNLFPRLSFLSGTTSTLTYPDGRVIAFNLIGGQWQADADVQERLAQSGSGWQVTFPEGRIEVFDDNGMFIASRHISGLGFAVAYPSAARTIITDSFGRSLTLDLDALGRLDHVTDPAGGVYRYTYDANGNLATVAYPDDTPADDTDNPVRTHHFEDARFPHALTGISDEIGERYATWDYDDQGRAILSTHAANASRVGLNYNMNSSTSVTDALGTVRSYSFISVLGVPRNNGVSQPGGPGCNASSSALTYDANGNVSSRSDFNNHKTCYRYDLARNLETVRLEGLDGAATCPSDLGAVAPAAGQRKVSTQWHPAWRLETRRAEPKKITTWVYNGQSDPTAGGAILSCAPADAYVVGTSSIAVLCKKVEQPTVDATGAAGFSAAADGGARVWAYTYDRYGHVLNANGPRTDVSDVTTFEYWPADAVCPGAEQGAGLDKGCRGELKRITNAVGHRIDYLKYNAHGQVLQMTDPNGVSITFTYDPRRHLTSNTADSKSTTYGYTPWGGLERVTLPDGSYTIYTYDPAHRLTDIADNVGNVTHYTLDAAGNVLVADTSDIQGRLAQRDKTDFDALGRQWKRYDARGYITEMWHDAMGAANNLIDAKGRATTYTRDTLGRLAELIDPLPTPGHTKFGWDGAHQLVSLTAPNGALNSFAVDGLGQMKQEQSADRGTLAVAYDGAGNLKTRRDASGRQSNYTYDAANRLTQVQQLSSSGQVDETLTYTWDAAPGCTYGVGRLCQLSDGAGSTTYRYDPKGNLLGTTRTEAGYSYTTAYTPDAVGRNVALITPTGALLDRGRDAGGRTTRLTATVGNTTQTVVSDIEYDGTGRVTSELLAGKLLTLTSYDTDGRLTTDDTTPQQPTINLSVAKPYVRLGEGLEITATLSVPQASGSIVLCEGDCLDSHLLGEQTVLNGVAPFTLTSLSRGIHRLWARYVAQAPFVDATSAQRTVFVAVPPFLLTETP